MSFTDKTLKTLEFDKICARLAELSPTEGARQMALALRPTSDETVIRRRMRRTTDAKRLALFKGHPSFSGVRDVGDAIARADKGAALSPRELMEIAAVLRAAQAVSDYGQVNRTFETVLDEIFARLQPNRYLESRISRAILAEDMIADEASPALAEIRRKIRAASNKIKDLMQQYTSGGATSKYLQENIVTTRGGRFVIPVKAEYRAEVKGLVHDTSASGATLFIEPMAVVDANNELSTLKSRETHEIERILLELSVACANVGESIRLNYLNLTELAYAFGCARLSEEMDAAEPILTERREIMLKQARHPLLDRRIVVPITVTLGDGYSLLVITGPNTGGKTVTLKTLGLFALMAQAGLHIPAAPGSTVCIFDQIFSDIGDEQSIEQSLSTFSSHMVGIVSILSKMTAQSLILFDELGAGTDPIEGAALAMAILEEVRQLGALCASTTHYAELKAYAIETEGVQNASCEFDVETLRPTYRLVIGTPGKSNAFAISEKLGLPPEIVRRAGNYVDSGARNLEDVIAKLEASRQALEAEHAESERLRAEYESFKKDAEKTLQDKIGRAEKDAARMRREAEQILAGAKATSHFVYDQLENLKKQRDSEKLGEKLSETKRQIRRRVNEYEDSTRPAAQEEEEYVLPRPLVKGDKVLHRNLGAQGILLDAPDKNGNVSLRIGQVKTRANIRDLKLIGDAETEGERQKRAEKEYRLSVSRSFSPQLDVRGQTGDDAWFMVDKYLDEAAVATIHSVTIIHGKGTGALRNALWNYLKKDSRVASFRAGAYGEGDYGVTVVDLK